MSQFILDFRFDDRGAELCRRYERSGSTRLLSPEWLLADDLLRSYEQESVH